MPVRPWCIGVAVLLPLAAAADQKTEPADMELIEFLGSIDTRGNSGPEVLGAIDAGLLPDLPEEPPHDEAK